MDNLQIYLMLSSLLFSLGIYAVVSRQNAVAILMGIVTRKWLAKRRILFWGGFLGISFIFSPDPTGMAPLIVAFTMVVLFEGTLLAARWIGRE